MTKTQYNSKAKSASFWKWIMCFMFLIGIWTTGAQAQTTVTIGSGTGTGNYIPIYPYYGYTYSQAIYQASELSAGGAINNGQITKIRYKLNAQPGANSNLWTVFLGNTSKSSFSSTSDWEVYANLTQVFSGTVTFPANGNWMEIVLTTPYIYSGGNLVVAVDENQPNYGNSGACWYSYTSGVTNSGLYFYSDGTNPNPVSPVAGTRITTLPQIQFDMVGGSPCTGTPTPGNTTSSLTTVCPSESFNLGLQNVTSGTGVTYQWQSSTDNITYTNIPSATNPTYSTTQSANTWYQCIVTCTNSGQSGTSTPIQVTTNPFYNCYCASGATTTADEEIFGVTVGSMSNSSTCTTTGCGVGSTNSMYSNYKGCVTGPSVMQGETVPILLTLGYCGTYAYSNTAAVYIDYNQNGSFADAGELVFTKPYGAGTLPSFVASGSFMVPFSALTGTTGMRVVYAEGSAANACGTYGYGETEDYDITINLSTNCTGTPTPGNTLADQTSVCSGQTINLSLQNSVSGAGITYDWQSSPDGVTWTSTGGTQPFYSTTQSVATYYQCVVTCTFSGQSATSTPVSVTMNPVISCYCASSAAYTGDEEILNVTFGSLNNSSTCSTTGTGPGSVLSMYSNYMSGSGAPAAPSVMQGTTVPFSIGVGTCGGNYSNMSKIFIDWNQDGDFADAGEEVYVSPTYTTGAHTETGTIVVPISATVGQTAMRVITNETTSAASITPCGISSWGETEDYLINVTMTSGCTGAPSATIGGAPASICSNIAFTLNATPTGMSGYTYQFQNSTDGGLTWNNMGIADVYDFYNVASQSVTTMYQVIVTCTNSGLSSTSTPVTVTQNAPTVCYCVVTGGSSTYYLSNVTITGSTSFNNTSSTSPSGYTDYSLSYSAGQIPGGSVSFSLAGGPSGNTFGFGIWIDFNQNGDFNDAGEMVYNSNSYLSTTSGSFTVPLSALTGTTRMRVVAAYIPSNPTPCAPSTYTEYEDYSFVVVPLAACSGTPAPGNTLSSVAQACSGVNFTLSLQNSMPFSGLTYQWQSADDAAFTLGLTNLGTSATQTTSQTANKYYRCLVTCTNSGQSAYSAFVQVNVSNGCECISYCAATNAGSACITNVSFNTINNTTTCAAAPNYYSFESASTNLYIGSTYTFSVSCDGSAITSVWVDWNKDGVLDATEWYQPYTSATTGSISITVPNGAATGSTRMRVRSRLSGNTNGSGDACTAMGSGETEDYCITVIQPVPCSGTPAPGATVASANPACFVNALTLSTQNSMTDLGLTFNWLTSPDGVTWTSTGVTTPTMTVNQSAATYYMCSITCTNSGLSGNSTPLLVGQVLCYCTTPVYSMNASDNMCTYYNYIGNVTFAGINNSTNCDNTPPYYNYFSSQTATVNQSGSYQITISATASGASFQLYKVYIDYNDNGSFDDAGEMVYTSGFISTATNFTQGNIVIPMTAPLGTHRMRVRSTNPLNSNIDANSCSDDGYLGEAEDYNIVINPAPPCSGTPTPGATLSNKALACTSTTINLGLQNATPGTGVTYQWQSSADVAFTTPVNMGTAATQSTTQTATTYYRCLVTCSGNTGISTPVLVTSTTACYCTNPTTGSDGCALGLYINNVTFAGINNTSGCFSPVPYTTPFYSFFPTQLATTQQGNTYAFSASAPNNPGSYYQWYGVWIDFNDNGSFDDAGELVLSSVAGASTTNNQLTGNITIPLTATVGQHLMRVRTGNVSAAINSCSDNSVSGEVEDYLIDITAAPQCTTPTPGNTLTSDNAVCASETFNLSLQNSNIELGLSYQWQVSTAGAGGPWTNVGTNINTYSTTQTVTSWYQCVVSCSYSGISVTSTPVQVTQNAPSTCLCIPTTGGATSYNIINFTTTGAFVNINNSSSGTAMFEDFSGSVTGVVNPGSTFNFSMDVAGGSNYGYAIWIDYNGDGTFQPSEQVVSSSTYTYPPITGSIAVPLNATPGVKRMRILAAYTPSNPSDPCVNSGMGQYEDYSLNIMPPVCIYAPTYPADAGSACADVLTNTVPLSWPSLSGATGYDVYFGTNNPPTTLVSANQIGLTYNADVSGGAPIYYWMIVPQISGGGSSCSVWSFTLSPSPTPIASSGGDVCLGNDIYLSADNIAMGQSSGNTYSWTGPNGFNSTLQNPSISNPGVLYSGTYSVIVTNQYGCTASESTSLNVNPNPTLTIDSVQNVSCAGGTDGIIYVSASGGLAPYSYTSDFINFNTNGIMNNLPTGASIVYAADGNACQAQIVGNLTAISTAPPSQSVVVTPTIIGMPTYACPGTTANLSIPAVPGATKYIWDGPFGTFFNGNPMNQSPYTTTTPSVQITFSSSTTSFVSVGVQAANGCGASLRKIQKVRYQISTPKEITGATTMCANTNGSYTIAPVTDATSYQWMITGNATVVPSGTSAVVFFGPSWNGGTLCVAAKTPCYTTAYKCIAISKSASALNAITGPLSSCPNEVQTFNVLPCTGAASYNWTLPAGATGSSSTNSITATFGPTFTVGGNICVSVTSICGVTSTPKCRTVAQGLPSVPTSISGITNGLCNQSVNYTVPSSPGVTYNWTAPGTIVGNGNSSVNVTYGALTTGQLCVTASNTCGTSAARCTPLKGAPNSPIGLTAIPASWCANTQGIEFTADLGNTTGSYTLSWGYPSAPTATYVAGGGNSNALTLDWGTGNGSVVVTATNSCGAGSKAFAVTIGCKEGEMAKANQLNVYPNPTAGVLNVEYTAEKGTAQVTVLDLSGRVVMTQTHANAAGQNTLQLDLSKVAKGAYMLNVQTNGSNNQVRVVVE